MSSKTPSESAVFEVFCGLTPPGTPLTTPEVAVEFECTDRTIYNKLDALTKDGRLNTKKVGARGRVWWRPPSHQEANGRVESEATLTGSDDTEQVGAGAGYKDDNAQATEAMFRRVFEHVPGLYLIIEPTDYEIVAVSEAYLAATMTQRPEILGKTLFEVFPADPEDSDSEGVQRLQRSLERVESTGEADVIPVTYYPIPDRKSEDGGFEERWWSPTNSPVFDDAGEIDYIVHRVEDVTSVVRQLRADGGEELLSQLDTRDSHLAADVMLRSRELHRAKERAHDRLRESERRYCTLFESIDQGFCLIEKTESDSSEPIDFRYLEANPAFERHTGVGDVVGKTIREVFPDESEDVYDLYDTILQTGESVQFEYELDRDRILELSVFRIECESPRLGVLFKDITERKQQERLLVEQTELLERIASDVPLEDCLSALCGAVPRLSSGVRASIMLADDDRESFERPIAPDLLESWGAGLEHAPINDLVIGTCGEAVFQGEPITCENVGTDDRWSEEWRDLCIENGVFAGRSEPILDSEGKPVGSFMLCFDKPRTPNEWERQLAEFGTHIAGIAVERERSQRALKRQAELDAFGVELTDATRLLADPVEIQYEAARVLGEHIDLDRAHYGEVLEDGDTNVVHTDYYLGDVPSLAGEHQLTDFGDYIHEAFHADKTVVVEDYTNRHELSDEDRAAHEAVNIAAWIGVPLIKDGQLTAYFVANGSEPREWTDTEVGMVEEAAERTWSAVERARAEEEVREANNALERLNHASRGLMEASSEEIRDRAAPIFREVLDVAFAALWQYEEATGELRGVATHTDGETNAGAMHDSEALSERAWQAFISDEIEVIHDIDLDSSEDTALRSGALVAVGKHGVVYVGSQKRDAFDERSADLTETVGATVETAWDRAESKRALAEQNEELQRLDRLNSLIREVDAALVNADTREGIEGAVCERLAGSDLYEFAWIGEYDAATDTVTPREWVGVDSGYIEERSIPVADASTEDSVITAFRTGEIQVVGDVATDRRAVPWRENTLTHGGRSCISVPLAYDDLPYGVMSVYGQTPRPDERETDVLAELGDTIAHATNAVETSETLRTDRVVELTLRVTGANFPMCRLAEEAECTIEFEELVRRSNDDSNVFFTAVGIPTERLQAAGERSLAITELVALSERNDPLFRARFSEPTLAGRFTEQGAVVRTLTIEEGIVTAVVDLPQTADVREFVERTRESVPNVELLARRTRDRPLRSQTTFRAACEERLTARQQEVLQTAHLSGFFESPRIRTGTQIAASLDISQPTFTTHLRTAQRNVLDILFDARTQRVGDGSERLET